MDNIPSDFSFKQCLWSVRPNHPVSASFLCSASCPTHAPYKAFRQPQYIHTFYHLSMLNYFLPFLLPFNDFFCPNCLIWSPLLKMSILRLGMKCLFFMELQVCFLHQKCFPILRIHKVKRITVMWDVSLSWKKGPAMQWLDSFFRKGYKDWQRDIYVCEF